MASALRDGWKIRKLGDILDFFNGFAFKSKDTIESSNTKLIRMGNLYQNKLDLNRKIVYYPDNFISTYHKYLLKENDLIISLTGTAGKEDYGYTVKIPKNSCNLLLNQRIAKIVIKEEEKIIKNYLFHFLLSRTFLDELYKTANGTRQANLSTETMKNLLIFIPTTTEQQKIVTILDEAFTAIDKTKANTELNLQNAKELFESYLQDVFENKGEGWEEKTLGEIASVEYGFTDKSTEEGDFRYIRITDIDNNGKLIPSNKKYINYSKESEKFTLNNNDLLMARTGATFAKVLLYKEYEKSIFASYLIRINFTANIVNEFYWYFTKTNSYWNQANSLSSGAAQPHFNGAALKQVVFSFPTSINRQKELIKDFQQLQEQTKKLETIYTQKIQDLDELKKSILQKAFNGELT